MTERMQRDKLGDKPSQSVLMLDLPEGVPDPFEGVEHAAESTRGE